MNPAAIFGLWLLVGLALCQCAWCDEPLPAGWKQITHDGQFKQRPAWSPDGEKLLLTRHGVDSIQVIRCRADGTDEQHLFESPHPRLDAVYSPDGKRLAFTWDQVTPGQGDLELYLANADGAEPQPLFVTEGKLSHEEWVTWSPDGQWIACTSTRDENPELYRVKADGSERQRLTTDPANDVHPCYSPDGRQIVFATNRWGDFELAAYHLETGQITRMTESPGVDDYPAWSPDGRQIAFASLRSGDFEIYVIDADGAHPRNVTQRAGPDNFPTWSPQGELTFVSLRNGAWDVYQAGVE